MAQMLLVFMVKSDEAGEMVAAAGNNPASLLTHNPRRFS